MYENLTSVSMNGCNAFCSQKNTKKNTGVAARSVTCTCSVSIFTMQSVSMKPSLILWVHNHLQLLAEVPCVYTMLLLNRASSTSSTC